MKQKITAALLILAAAIAAVTLCTMAANNPNTRPTAQGPKIVVPKPAETNQDTLYQTALDNIQAAKTHSEVAAAISQIETLATNGMPDAQYAAGILRAGSRKFQDQKKAYYWFQLAAQQGVPDAAFQCAMACQHGTGTETNLNQSLIWLQLAQKEGHKEAGVLCELWKKKMGIKPETKKP